MRRERWVEPRIAPGKLGEELRSQPALEVRRTVSARPATPR